MEAIHAYPGTKKEQLLEAIHAYPGSHPCVSRGMFDRRRRLELGRGQELLVGLFLSIDLSKAFDKADRALIARAMRLAGVPEGLVTDAISLHSTCDYLLVGPEDTTRLRTTRGIRQGVQAGPAFVGVSFGSAPQRCVRCYIACHFSLVRFC